MSELHILFPTPVYQNFLEFRPSELKSMIDYVSNLDWASDKDIYEGPNGETTKLEADVLSEPELENLRKKIDEYTEYVGKLGAKGLAYIKVVDLDQDNGLQSPILKFFQQKTIDSILSSLNVQNNDIIFFGAGKADIVNLSMIVGKGMGPLTFAPVLFAVLTISSVV